MNQKRETCKEFLTASQALLDTVWSILKMPTEYAAQHLAELEALPGTDRHAMKESMAHVFDDMCQAIFRTQKVVIWADPSCKPTTIDAGGQRIAGATVHSVVATMISMPTESNGWMHHPNGSGILMELVPGLQREQFVVESFVETLPTATQEPPSASQSLPVTEEAMDIYKFSLPLKEKRLSWKEIAHQYAKYSGVMMDEDAIRQSFSRTKRALKRMGHL